ncbi:uncharacterized protein T26G10.4-like [Emydura macquarii macquarii]|uniref:uncharacterized protein T26G10.4-like n=1 Tax=Emydura macquarii macquarii TaxID=1129001 RepID=UPI00352B5CA7
MLDATSQAADWMGLRFNAKKCASLDVDSAKKASVQVTSFGIQGDPMIPLEEGQAYQHLGMPTGFRVWQTPEDTIQEILWATSRIEASLLAPWQKINTLNTFLIPRISFVLRGSAMAKVPLNKADDVIRHLVKGWLFLPQRASNELTYIGHKQGSANVPCIGNLCDIAVVTQAFHLLTCPNATVSTIASKALEEAVTKRIRRAPSSNDIATYLSSPWMERRELSVLVPRIRAPDHTIVTPRTRGMLERCLKASVHALYLESLKKKPDQGKVFEVTSKWDASNHFLVGGGYTRFADWWFIHRARLNCFPLNGAVCHGKWDKHCRRCGYVNKTLPHVLCGCKPHSRAWQLRHNTIQDHLVKAIPAH